MNPQRLAHLIAEAEARPPDITGDLGPILILVAAGIIASQIPEARLRPAVATVLFVIGVRLL